MRRRADLIPTHAFFNIRISILKNACVNQIATIEIKKLAIRSDIKDTNIAAWKSGRRDFTQDSMDKLKAAFTLEQRTIFLALVEIFFIVGAEKMQRIRPQN